MSTLNFPKTEFVILECPLPHILLITLNRPKVYNALHYPAHWELHNVFNWAEKEPDIWVVVLTGAGNKAFCSGMDLKSVNEIHKDDKDSRPEGTYLVMPPSGFGGISRRNFARKPVVAAVDGFAMGGGMEIVLSCDIVIATEKSIFGLPEVKRGLIANQGGIARIVHALGYQRACEVALTGRKFTAVKAHEYGWVNEVVKKNVIERALAWAKEIAENSPDSVQMTKQGLLLGLESASLTAATDGLERTPEYRAFESGENLREGVAAFVEKRLPKWKNPAVTGSKL